MMIAEGRIFLAHAREDKAQVRRLYADLKARGFEPWFDEVDLVPGQVWKDEISKAIRQAGVFLACLSSRSVKKAGYVQNEFRQALSAFGERPPGTIYLIPVRLDECDAPDLHIPDRGLSLRDIHWVDLWEEGGFDRLALAIEMALGPAVRLSDLATPDRQQAVRIDTPRLYQTLTPRESEVLARLRQGKPNATIAHELDMGEATVKVFVRSILKKLRALNRTEVAHLGASPTEPEKLLSKPINEEALEAYTKWKYPGLPIDQCIQQLLLSDLDKNLYKNLCDLDHVIDMASDAVANYEKEKPEMFESGTDYLTKSLGFADEKFRAQHRFSRGTREAFSRYGHLVKGEDVCGQKISCAAIPQPRSGSDDGV